MGNERPDDYRAGKRIAPSRRITSPLSMSIAAPIPASTASSSIANCSPFSASAPTQRRRRALDTARADIQPRRTEIPLASCSCFEGQMPASQRKQTLEKVGPAVRSPSLCGPSHERSQWMGFWRSTRTTRRWFPR